MEKILWLSVATASISFTLSETQLFLPFREWLFRQSKFLGKLINCGYCTGHWIALVVAAIYKPSIFDSFWMLDFLLCVVIIAWLAGIQWAFMCWLMKVSGK
jgi:hypothetical protein